MAKLRLGEIELDDGRPAVGSFAPPAASNARGVSPKSAIQFFSALPLRGAWLIGIGLMLVLGGLTFLLASDGQLDVFKYVFRGGIFIPPGVGLIAVGLIKNRIDAAHQQRLRDAEGARVALVAERVRTLLLAPGVHQTAEWVAEEAHLSRAEAIRALFWLRERGELMEDLDASTGAFHYWAKPSFPKSLDRLSKELER